MRFIIESNQCSNDPKGGNFLFGLNLIAKTKEKRDQMEKECRLIHVQNGDLKLDQGYENTHGNMRVIDGCVKSMKTGELAKVGLKRKKELDVF